jgi:tetratricopeptide (TPR) repeat protein
LTRAAASLLVASLTILPGCTAPQVAIRPQASPLAAGQQSAAFRVAEARGHFALGNIALASEGFRRALREEPVNVDAMNGLAACYDRMGRFDLSRSYYERALALAPNDPRLYANLATSLALQGKADEAAAVWAELAQRLGTGGPVSVALPAPRPVVTASDEADPLPLTAAARLERISLAEVMLVTRNRPEVPKAAERMAMTSAAPAPAVVLLNAARVERLAATTRERLRQLGWKDVAIGDSTQVLPVSRITYPEHRREEARQMARQLRIDLRQPLGGKGDKVVVLLGRDLAGRKPGA